jgi:hypothetical protein
MPGWTEIQLLNVIELALKNGGVAKTKARSLAIDVLAELDEIDALYPEPTGELVVHTVPGTCGGTVGKRLEGSNGDVVVWRTPGGTVTEIVFLPNAWGH